MVNKVLMIAFHFPPLHGSSGIRRTTSFVQHLPAHGWTPLVLSADPRAYPATAEPTPDACFVHRAFALDAARHLAWRGRYLRACALPDRWATWALSAIPAALRIIRRERPRVLWSTSPIASAQLIGLVVHKLTGLPWIADLRDPLTDAGYPEDRWIYRACRILEGQALRRCTAAVFTTRGALEDHRTRYPGALTQRWRVIENGYDEEAFPAVEPVGDGFTLLHSGVVYPSERDPRALFVALGMLQRERALPAGFRLLLRASGHDVQLRAMAATHGAEGVITFGSPVSYRAALAEMQASHGLLVLQAANCNRQVPAKLYEYLRAGRPILGLTDPAGDTAGTLRSAGIHAIAPLDDATAIRIALRRFIDDVRNERAAAASAEAVRGASRTARAAQLAELLDEVVLTAGA
jgi:glycosyltransferase involved in cell wall biosynthesis